MILVTGHLGYIGPILTQKLTKNGLDWRGIDAGFFVEHLSNPNLQIKDIRHIDQEDLAHVESIVHLASLSNDPLGEINPSLTHDINAKETIRLARLAKKAGVKKFIFFSSCSVYGIAHNPDDNVTEDYPTNPLTVYAESKLEAERGILALEDDDFLPVCLRFGTAYGVSPHMRADLVVNNLMGTGFFNKNIEILSDGTPWRPLIHIEDMSETVLACLKATKSDMRYRIYNIGKNEENYQVQNLAQIVQQIVGDVHISILGKPGNDNRSYRVDFSRFKKDFGDILSWNVSKGCQEIHKWLLESGIQNIEDYFSSQFIRIKKLKEIMGNQTYDHSLYLNFK